MTERVDLACLEEVLEFMLLDNADITARGGVRCSGGRFKNPSDITRNPQRREKLKLYRARQFKLRMIMEKVDKQSKTKLTVRLAKLEAENAVLVRDRDLLIASHKWRWAKWEAWQRESGFLALIRGPSTNSKAWERCRQHVYRRFQKPVLTQRRRRPLPYSLASAANGLVSSGSAASDTGWRSSTP